MSIDNRLEGFFADKRKLLLLGLSSKENRKQLELLYKKWGLKKC